MELPTIGNHEKNYVIDGVQDGIRNDGRRLTDYRPIFLETNVILSANGSARVKIGSTDVLVAVKAELASSEKEDIRKKLRFFVDVSPVASPTLAGKVGQELGEELTSIFTTAYDNEEEFCDIHRLVLSALHSWILYVDATIIQLEGNAIDAISLGVKAALINTKICNVIVRPADEGKTVIDLPEEASTWSLDFLRAPIITVVHKIGDCSVVDPNSTEEECSTSSLIISTIPSKINEEEYVISSVKKRMRGTLEIHSIEEMLNKAVGSAKIINTALFNFFQQNVRGEQHIFTFCR